MVFPLIKRLGDEIRSLADDETSQKITDVVVVRSKKDALRTALSARLETCDYRLSFAAQRSRNERE